MPTDSPGGASERIAIVMSGGGARGAYEAGVLSYLLDEFPARLGRPVHFDIVTGTSVGAIHACYVAAAQDDAGAGSRLAKIWRSLSLESVYPVGATDLFRVPWKLIGLGAIGDLLATSESAPARLEGLLDTTRLEELVLGHIPWRQIRSNIDGGTLQALAVAATEIATGRSIVFVDTPTGAVPQWARDPFVVARADRIKPAHALASAAIPLLFPAIRIGGAYYCDGGLRLNTPLAPALRLGADRVLVIGLRHPTTPQEEDRLARRRETSYARTTYLAGKVLNALLLDRIEYDVDRLRLFNAILGAGVQAYGHDFLKKINEPIIEMRKTPYRIVDELFLRPSQDLGVIAAECLDQEPSARGVRSWFSRSIARYAARGALGEADLLSYLFFDRCYADRLIGLGHDDAERSADDLIRFFS